MDYITTFIKPELLILVPVLYFCGLGLKKSETTPDKLIPLILGGGGVLLSLMWVLATSAFAGWQSVILAAFTAIAQGVLCAGASVYCDQLIKQSTKND